MATLSNSGSFRNRPGARSYTDVVIAGRFSVFAVRLSRMHRRPVIGITTQTLQSIDRIPEDLPESWVMNQRYFYACTAAGAIPWMVPLMDDEPETLRGIYDRLDGLFLPGGVDMAPASYGCDRHDLCG